MTDDSFFHNIYYLDSEWNGTTERLCEHTVTWIRVVDKYAAIWIQPTSLETQQMLLTFVQEIEKKKCRTNHRRIEIRWCNRWKQKLHSSIVD